MGTGVFQVKITHLKFILSANSLTMSNRNPVHSAVPFSKSVLFVNGISYKIIQNIRPQYLEQGCPKMNT